MTEFSGSGWHQTLGDDGSCAWCQQEQVRVPASAIGEGTNDRAHIPGSSHWEDQNVSVFPYPGVCTCVHMCMCEHAYVCTCNSLLNFKLNHLVSRRPGIWASVLEELMSHTCIQQVHECVRPFELESKGLSVFAGELQSWSVREEDWVVHMFYVVLYVGVVKGSALSVRSLHSRLC